MNRITQSQLNYLVDELNTLTNSPLKAYTRTESGAKANIGNFHLYQAYGAIGLHRMCNEGGGITEIIGLSTKRELYYQLRAMINGIELGKAA